MTSVTRFTPKRGELDEPLDLPNLIWFCSCGKTPRVLSSYLPDTRTCLSFSLFFSYHTNARYQNW